MAIRVGANVFDASGRTLGSRGMSYSFVPGQPVGRNGLGEVQLAGGAMVTWIWSYLTKAEYEFLVTTVCGGAASKRYKATGEGDTTILYNDKQVEQTFAHCVVLRPTYKEFVSGIYREVTLIIDSLF